MKAERHDHTAGTLCAAGLEVYTRALREGHVSAPAAAAAPCLFDAALLYPAIDDLNRLQPVAPAVALQRLLRSSEDRIADERRRAQQLAVVFEPLLQADGRYETSERAPLLTIHGNMEHIGQVIAEAMVDAHEVLAIQPHRSYAPSKAKFHESALRRDQALLDRGGRIRALYHHTLRHALPIAARYEQLKGDVEARTLDEVTERLIVIDRAVAFIPANADRSLALEVRHPALVDFFATTYDCLWRLATPMYPEAVQQPTLNGVTPRQRAIATLLVEGHTDSVIADRLGMNVRTARVHIAKLATALGSESRAQLGYLIGQSEILTVEDRP